jgi:hypothetical protein
MDDLEVIADPVPRIVAVRGATLEILPLPFRKMGRFSKALDPCMKAILAGQWQSALEDQSEALISAVAIATGRDEVWVGDLYGDDFLRLCDAVLEVNQDFFGQQIMPAVVPLAARLAALMQPAGATLPPFSSNADTDPPTS